MAYIKVDCDKLEITASAIESYIRLMKSKMNQADGEVNTLSANWQGSDYTQFRGQWARVTNGDSAYFQMVKSLESYAKYLRYAEKKYKDAQAKTLNRASSLFRYE